MSDKPLIIKCNLMLPVDKIREVRESVLKQMEDGVVILPDGFELATVDVHLLEEVKSEILEYNDLYKDSFHWSYAIDYATNVINKYIKKLKGE